MAVKLLVSIVNVLGAEGVRGGGGKDKRTLTDPTQEADACCRPLVTVTYVRLVREVKKLASPENWDSWRSSMLQVQVLNITWGEVWESRNQRCGNAPYK